MKNINFNRVSQIMGVFSFAMGVYSIRDTIKNREGSLNLLRNTERILQNQAKIIENQSVEIENNELLNEGANVSKITEEGNRILAQYSEEVDPGKKSQIIEDNFDKLAESSEAALNYLEKVQEIIRNRGSNSNNFWNWNSSITENYHEFLNRCNEFNSYLATLPLETQLAITNIIGCFVIGITLISIVGIFFGNEVIKFLKLEERYPRLKSLLELRLRFQRYYLFINILLITLILLAMVYINALILLY